MAATIGTYVVRSGLISLKGTRRLLAQPPLLRPPALRTSPGHFICGPDSLMDEVFCNQKIPRGRPATGQGTPIQVRVADHLLSEIDRWIASHPTARSRPQAIRGLVELALGVGAQGSGRVTRSAKGPPCKRGFDPPRSTFFLGPLTKSLALIATRKNHPTLANPGTLPAACFQNSRRDGRLCGTAALATGESGGWSMAGGQITTAVIELFGVSSAALATHARMFEEFNILFLSSPAYALGIAAGFAAPEHSFRSALTGY